MTDSTLFRLRLFSFAYFRLGIFRTLIFSSQYFRGSSFIMGTILCASFYGTTSSPRRATPSTASWCGPSKSTLGMRELRDFVSAPCQSQTSPTCTGTSRSRTRRGADYRCWLGGGMGRGVVSRNNLGCRDAKSRSKYHQNSAKCAFLPGFHPHVRPSWRCCSPPPPTE